MTDLNLTRRLPAILAALSPLLIHPALIFATRRSEKLWPTLAQPSITPTIDIALPIISALIGFVLLARFVKRSWLPIGILYVPVMVSGLLYISLFVFGYAWRDFP